MTDREKIAEAIESGRLLCGECPKQGVEEGYFVGAESDGIEVSKACWLCGVVEGHAMGTTDELIDEIGEEKLQYLINQ